MVKGEVLVQINNACLRQILCVFEGEVIETACFCTAFLRKRAILASKCGKKHRAKIEPK